MVLFLQELEQRVAVGADRLVGDHVGEVVDAVKLLGGLVQAFADIILGIQTIRSIPPSAWMNFLEEMKWRPWPM